MWKTGTIAAASIVVAGCSGSGHPAATVTSTQVITKTVMVTPPPPPTAAPKTTMDTDGTYRVGIDILPGNYHSGGISADGESDCYWARLNSLNPTHIITNNLGPGPQAVTIQPGDTAFLTHSCQPWRKTD